MWTVLRDDSSRFFVKLSFKSILSGDTEYFGQNIVKNVGSIGLGLSHSLALNCFYNLYTDQITDK
jgi:hypothetical protein